MAVEEQVAVIYAGVRGHIDKMNPARITAFEEEFLQHIRASHQDILKSIREQGMIDTATDEKLKAAVLNFLAGFE